MELNGIYTALITPFNDDFSINEEEYQKVINQIIDEGVFFLRRFAYWKSPRLL